MDVDTHSRIFDADFTDYDLEQIRAVFLLIRKQTGHGRIELTIKDGDIDLIAATITIKPKLRQKQAINII